MTHSPQRHSRRLFLKSSATMMGAAAAWSLPTRSAFAGKLPSESPTFGFIGAGLRYENLVFNASEFGPAAAICDVDATQLRRAEAILQEVHDETSTTPSKPMFCDDYRRILDQPDIDAVVIATPDHWHTKIAIEAMRAGKDVYCEKPLTLTIDEGQQILKTLAETDRVFQVGSQQRSGPRFQKAVGLMRAGRVGSPKRVTCAIEGSPSSSPLPVTDPPSELNWDRWLGPAPQVSFRTSPTLPEVDDYGSEFPYSRCHAHFRWWYEYAGGKLTDWGAHHVDIAMWALDKSDGNIGLVAIDPRHVSHPVEFVDGYPVRDDCFNTANEFHVRVTFADGVELDIVNDAQELGFQNGVMFEGDKGRYFVNRGRLTGKPVEALDASPLPDEVMESIYNGLSSQDIDPDERAVSHMQNFVECLKTRETPISDVASHHRHLSLCHAANVALRLGRKLTFDPQTERFVDDDQANQFVARTPRAGYETES
ncbi:MAG: Gfo/Idh/MocA family oxidoreductase [Planctomycetota bacterium]